MTYRPQYKFCSECKKEGFKQTRLKASRRFFEKNSGVFAEGKIQCQVCGKWYIQVCSHVLQKHAMDNREYKKYIGTYLKKGLVPDWYHSKKREIYFTVPTPANLEKGKKYWFKKGSEIAGKYERSDKHIEELKTRWGRVGALGRKKKKTKQTV